MRDGKVARKRASIVRAIHAWAESHEGEPPTVSDWKGVRGTRWPSYVTAVRYFGSWDKAISAAGYVPRGRGRPVE